MLRVFEHNLNIHEDTLIICYGIPFEVSFVVARTEDELRELVEGNLGKLGIRILCEEDRAGIGKEWGRVDGQGGKGRSLAGKSVISQPHKQQDLLQELQQDSQIFAIEKAQSILESMIRKTQKKMLQSSTKWTLERIQADLLKYQQARQSKISEGENKGIGKAGDKKWRKQMKMLDKKLEELAEQKEILMSSVSKGFEDDDKNKELSLIFQPPQNNSQSSLLCNQPNFQP